jgi:hypothetical protein
MQPLFALDQRPRGKALAVQIEEVELRSASRSASIIIKLRG